MVPLASISRAGENGFVLGARGFVIKTSQLNRVRYLKLREQAAAAVAARISAAGPDF